MLRRNSDNPYPINRSWPAETPACDDAGGRRNSIRLDLRRIARILAAASADHQS